MSSFGRSAQGTLIDQVNDLCRNRKFGSAAKLIHEHRAVDEIRARAALAHVYERIDQLPEAEAHREAIKPLVKWAEA